jgi:hypothetical protein
MKKTYQAPQVQEHSIQLGAPLLATSDITPEGSSYSLLFSDTSASQDEEARTKTNTYSVWDDDWFE